MIQGAERPPLSLEALQQFVEARKSTYQHSIAEMRSNPAYLFDKIWNDILHHPIGVQWHEAVLPSLPSDPQTRAQRFRQLNILLHRAFRVRVWRTYCSLGIFTFIGNNLAELKDSGFTPRTAKTDLMKSKKMRTIIWEINFLLRNQMMWHLRTLLDRALAASPRMACLFTSEFVRTPSTSP